MYLSIGKGEARLIALHLHNAEAVKNAVQTDITFLIKAISFRCQLIESETRHAICMAGILINQPLASGVV